MHIEGFARVSNRGQVTIPIAVRKILGISTPSHVYFLRDDDSEPARIMMVSPSAAALFMAQRRFEMIARRAGVHTPHHVNVLIRELRKYNRGAARNASAAEVESPADNEISDGDGLLA